MKKIIVLCLVLATSLAVFAQKSRFGHVDSNAIFSVMPEREQATKAVEDYARILETQLQQLNAELETKYNDYMAGKDTYSPSILQMKEDELVNLQQRIQAFQVRAQEDMQNKELELLEPIYTKIQDAIKAVGLEKSLIYVFDVSTLLYVSDESVDITPDVKIKLGIK
jgi:outer membrane protein